MKVSYQALTSAHLEEFRKILSDEFIITNSASLQKYAHDENEDYHCLPSAVLIPRTSEEISQIMRICHKNHIPVTPRGAGTGLSGGAVSIYGGVILSMERFNEILEIDTLNLQATVETGVITEVFQEAVKAQGLFYPPDPSSRGTCFIGGNLAHCSGGPKAVKYGVTKDFVLNLEVVLATGEIIWTGANVLKNATGYNLTQLMVGSEGTLGIITKVVFKLKPLPTKDVTLLVPFFSSVEAMKAISAIYLAGITPSAVEFMDRDAIEMTARYLKEKMNIQPNIPLPEGIESHLIIELDGNEEELLFKEAEKITEVLANFPIDEIWFADNEKQKNELWQLRRNIAHGVTAYSVSKMEDVVVPRGNLPTLMEGVKKISQKYGFRAVGCGHAGDGNLHILILKDEQSDAYWESEVPKAMKEMFELTIQLGGMLSGEHGIGIAKKEFMDIAFQGAHLMLMKGIKQVFDPHYILNPGKIFD